MTEVLEAERHEPTDEELKILEWRISQLETFGMSHEMAVEYGSRNDVELNEFRVLLQNGCPPHLVARVSSLETV